MPAPEPVTLARNAMATRFEIVLHGDDPVAVRAAGEEALAEVERIEAQLSLYRNTSEIAHLNARAAREAVRVSPALFRLLDHAARLSAETGGAFDITIAPLVRCWGFIGGTGKMPSREAIEEARSKVGMNLVLLDAGNYTVRFAQEGVMLDLGAIGKGYAIERAAEILREDGVTSAMLHGGTSTVHAIGHPPGAVAWQVAIEHPQQHRRGQSGPDYSDTASGATMTALPVSDGPNENGSEVHLKHLAVVSLRDEAMSVSAAWGRSFQSGGKDYGHVIDPRTGQPTEAALLSVVVLPSATETDALSTALLTLGPSGLGQISTLRKGTRCLVASQEEEGLKASSVGIDLPA